MKARILLLCMLITFGITRASAKGTVLYGNGETVEKVMELPQREEFKILAQDGKWYHADLGIKHEQFSLFGVPIWNYGTEKYVLYTDTQIEGYDYTYADLSSSDVRYLRQEFSSIPAKPELSFWTRIGGKLVVLTVLGVFIFVKSID